MFGETAAVYGFLRFSRAIAALAAALLDLVLVEFFDDFTQIEPSLTAKSAQLAFEGLLDVLGWKVAMTEKKRKPFSASFVSLGVLLDFTSLSEGRVTISNKPGRVSDILVMIENILASGRLGFKEALSLQGKLTFAEGQTFGRVAAPAARHLSEWAKIRASRELSVGLKLALETVGPVLAAAPHRTIEPCSSVAPIVILTDGACEREVSIGGVLFDGEAVECFGAVLEEELINEWKTRLDQHQVIGQAEIFPTLIARLTWAARMKGCRVLYFIDNDSARLALIKSYSPSLPSLKMVMQCLQWDFENRSVPWYARVPTHSNLADDPSRMCANFLVRTYNAQVVPPVFPVGTRAAWYLK